MEILINGAKAMGGLALDGIYILGSGVIAVLESVKTGYCGDFNWSSTLLSNVMWMAFFPIRAASTVAQHVFILAVDGCTSALAMLFVLLKFPLGVEIATGLCELCNNICKELLPKSFAHQKTFIFFPSAATKTKLVNFKQMRKLSPTEAVGQTIGIRIMWMFGCPVFFCLFALGRSLVVLASIAQTGASAIKKIGEAIAS
ncbi:MAG: hypothetical protein LBC42_01690 [Puniceicoccales bacterium]|jgi:hypothetical protein|nr:hypothetical protein [Puniceicoccales bacterium]